MKAPDWSKDDVELYCGDCLEILPQLPAGSVDAVVTDPPYGIETKFGEIATRAGYGDGKGKGTRKLQFAWDGPGVRHVSHEGLCLAFELCQASAACVVWTGFDAANCYADAARRYGFTVKPMAWIKKCPPPAGFGCWWPSAFELGFYGYRRGAWFGDTDVCRRNTWEHDSYRHGQPGKVGHPTQKPLALMNHHVASIVPPHGLCIDPFMGSGTTGVACVKTGRKFIGIEKEPKYFDIAVKRIEEAFESIGLFRGTS